MTGDALLNRSAVELIGWILVLADDTDSMPGTEPRRQLLAARIALDSRPWADWKAGKPMTTKALAAQLKPFDIFPMSDGARRGYVVASIVMGRLKRMTASPRSGEGPPPPAVTPQFGDRGRGPKQAYAVFRRPSIRSSFRRRVLRSEDGLLIHRR